MSLITSRTNSNGDIITTYVESLTVDSSNNKVNFTKFVGTNLETGSFDIGSGSGSGSVSIVEDATDDDGRLTITTDASGDVIEIKTSSAFRTEIDGMNTTITDNRTRSDNADTLLGGKIDTETARIDNMLTTQSDHNTRITSLEGGSGVDLTPLNNNVTLLQSRTTVLETDNTSHHTNHTSHITRLDNLETNVNNIVAGSSVDLDTLKEVVDAYQLADTSIISNVATNTSDIATNTSNITTNASAISTNTSNLTTISSNVSTNTGNISTNTSDISALQTKASNNETNITNLQALVSTNTTNISTNLTSIQNNISEISNINSRITTLENTPSFIIEELHENPIFSSNSTATLDGSAVTGYVVSSKSFHSAGYAPWKAFNHGTGLWHTSSTDLSDEWLQIQYPDPVFLIKYTLAPRDDGAQYNTMFPAEWDIEASNDGSLWTVIDTQSGITSPGFGNTSEFIISGNTTMYSFYKLNARFSTLNGNTTTNTIAIGEWRLFNGTGGSGGGSGVEPSNYIKSISHTTDSISYTNQSDLVTTMNFDNFITTTDNRLKSVSDSGSVLTFTNELDSNTLFDYSNLINTTELNNSLTNYVHKTSDSRIVSVNDTGTRLQFIDQNGNSSLTWDHSIFTRNTALPTLVAPYLHKTNDQYVKTIVKNTSTNSITITKGNDSTFDYAPTQNDFTDALKTEVESIAGIKSNFTLLENNLNNFQTPDGNSVYPPEYIQSTSRLLDSMVFTKQDGNLDILSIEPTKYIKEITGDSNIITIKKQDDTIQNINLTSSQTNSLFCMAYLQYRRIGANGVIEFSDQGSGEEKLNITLTSGTLTSGGYKNIHITFDTEFPTNTNYKVQVTPINFQPDYTISQTLKVIDKGLGGFVVGFSNGAFSTGMELSVFCYHAPEAEPAPEPEPAPAPEPPPEAESLPISSRYNWDFRYSKIDSVSGVDVGDSTGIDSTEGLIFDGTNRITNHVPIQFGDPSGNSVSFFIEVKWTNYKPFDTMTVVQFPKFSFNHVVNTGKDYFFLRGIGDIGTPGNIDILNINTMDETPLALDVFHKILYTVDGDTEKLYINGVFIKSATSKRVPRWAPHNMDGFTLGDRIGSSSYDSGPHFEGSIKRMVIWDRALSNFEALSI